MTFKLEGGFTGDKFLASSLQVIRNAIPREFRKALVAIGERKLAQAQALVPVDTGDLKSTGTFSVRAGAQQVMLAVGFGGPRAPYAAKVHEDLEAHHDDGQAKFLETVFNQGGLGEELAAEIKLG